MKRILIVLLLLTGRTGLIGQEIREPLLVMFWNMENFFDYTDQGTGESDKEFSSMGGRHWTRKKFYRKCDSFSKAVFWIAGQYGRMPDVIGLAEIENRGVLVKLLSHTLLRKYDYRIIHHDSPDRRGIDVALLYRSSVLEPFCVSRHIPVYKGDTLNTREILHVGFEDLKYEGTFDFAVNHHPSKFGGSVISEGRRSAAMRTLKELCDSIRESGGGPIIAMGDFNDTPDAASFDCVHEILVNKGIPLHERGEGTIRYEGRWELIDMFLVSPEIDRTSDMEICRIPFLMTWEKKHPGEKPLRTYLGPRYTGGVSDHCPIVLKVTR